MQHGSKLQNEKNDVLSPHSGNRAFRHRHGDGGPWRGPSRPCPAGCRLPAILEAGAPMVSGSRGPYPRARHQRRLPDPCHGFRRCRFDDVCRCGHGVSAREDAPRCGSDVRERCVRPLLAEEFRRAVCLPPEAVGRRVLPRNAVRPAVGDDRRQQGRPCRRFGPRFSDDGPDGYGLRPRLRHLLCPQAVAARSFRRSSDGPRRHHGRDERVCDEKADEFFGCIQYTAEISVIYHNAVCDVPYRLRRLPHRHHLPRAV